MKDILNRLYNTQVELSAMLSELKSEGDKYVLMKAIGFVVSAQICLDILNIYEEKSQE